MQYIIFILFVVAVSGTRLEYLFLFFNIELGKPHIRDYLTRQGKKKKPVFSF